MKNSVCFIGHRETKESIELREKVYAVIVDLVEKGYKKFIFGDHSSFTDICHGIAADVKNVNKDITIIHYRCNYENAGEYTMQFLILGYDQSIFPAGIRNSGRASYIERDRAMIDSSDMCIFYYDEKHQPSKSRVSGTAKAYEYALSKHKTIINLY